MNFIKKVIKKIKEGLLQEMYVEAKWMYQYIKRYKFAVAFYLILGVISTTIVAMLLLSTPVTASIKYFERTLPPSPISVDITPKIR